MASWAYLARGGRRMQKSPSKRALQKRGNARVDESKFPMP
jgi:hypothetical protein